MAHIRPLWCPEALSGCICATPISRITCSGRRTASWPIHAAPAVLKRREGRRQLVRVWTACLPAGSTSGPFDLPAAPLLIPEGSWREVDGCVCAPKGFKAQGMAAGLRAAGGKADLALVVADGPAAAAGIFTTNVMCAAPVTYCREVLASTGHIRAVLINAGQANAATGDQGYRDCLASAEAVAAALGVPAGEVLLLSTGVIGRRIKMDALLAAVPRLAANLGSGAEDAMHAAVAITTTDLVSKSAALEVEIGGHTVRVGGFAKGSGMIHPNMATMLCVITTDAAVNPEVWRGIIRRGGASSFNQITVDGDTSTNDTILGLASGVVGHAAMFEEGSQEAQQLEAAVTALLQGLAKSIAWDGEGATCLIEAQVKGAQDDAAARAVSKSVVGSLLVKAAIFGHDPNWGRIACAAGYAGVSYDPNSLGIVLGETPLMHSGQPLEFDAKAASSYLAEVTQRHGTVHIQLSLGDGPGTGVAWGCDLSYDYVKINAEYTT